MIWLILRLAADMLALFAIAVLVREVRVLRAGIRAHRDARGNDRCYLDDAVLYRLLRESAAKALTVLPERATFLANCARFHANRQHPLHVALFHGAHDGGVTPTTVVDPVAARIQEARARARRLSPAVRARLIELDAEATGNTSTWRDFDSLKREIERQSSDSSAVKELKEMIEERMETVAALRRVCAEFGDDDWTDDMNLVDVIEKHLECYLGQEGDDE